MELKTYQQHVMDDLSAYLGHLNRDSDMIAAWKGYWMDKDISVGFGGVPAYKNSIAGVPHVCMKVPTGGGKTFMACAALKRIFDAMPLDKPRVVVCWCHRTLSSPRQSAICPIRNINTACGSILILPGKWRSTPRKCCSAASSSRRILSGSS